MNNGQFTQAYQLLKPYEFTIAGDSDYDYWLGLSALETGHAAEATIALERVLSIEPDFLGARLDLARAYYELNHHDLAKQQLTELLTLNPPAEARAMINDYLEAINNPQHAAPTASTATQWLKTVEFSVGFDSNVNNSTNQSQIFIAGLGNNIALAESSTRSEAGFLRSKFSLGVNYPLHQAFQVYNQSYFEHTELSDFHSFETSEVTNRSGVQWASGTAGNYRLEADLNGLYLDNRHYRDAATLTLNWDYPFQQQQFNAFAQINYLRYAAEANASNDSNLSLAGFNWLYRFNADNRSFLALSLFGGVDNDTAGRLDGNSQIEGFRLSGQQALFSKVDGFFNLNYQRNHYDQYNPLFATTREDKAYGAQFGFKIQSSNHWLFQPSLDYYDNQSNLAINDYQRIELKLSLSRSF